MRSRGIPWDFTTPTPDYTTPHHTTPHHTTLHHITPHHTGGEVGLGWWGGNLGGLRVCVWVGEVVVAHSKKKKKTRLDNPGTFGQSVCWD
jgi:hypothetical protein